MRLVTLVTALVVAIGSTTGAIIEGLGEAAAKSAEQQNSAVLNLGSLQRVKRSAAESLGAKVVGAKSAVAKDAKSSKLTGALSRGSHAKSAESLASSKELAVAARALLAKLNPGAPPGPSPYSADCYYRGKLRKHEEVFVIDQCNSHCTCDNGELECERLKCKDAYKAPKPTDYLEKHHKKKQKRDPDAYNKEEERKRKAEEQRKREEEAKRKYDTEKPAPSRKPEFHYDDVPNKNPPLRKPYPPKPYPQKPYNPRPQGGYNPEYPSLQFPDSFFSNIATDNGIYSGNFQDTFASIFRPVFGSGASTNILNEASRIGSGHVHFNSRHSGSGHTGFGGSGFASGYRSSQKNRNYGRVQGTSFRRGYNYDHGYQTQGAYATGSSDYGSHSYGTSASQYGGHGSGHHGAHGSSHDGYHGDQYNHGGGGH